MIARKISKSLLITLLVGTVLTGGCSAPEPDPRERDVNARIARLHQVRMEFDAHDLSERKREMLKLLIEAGKLVHEAYLRQVYPRGVHVRDSLAGRGEEINRHLLRLFIRNGGPFDKMDGFKNFFDQSPKQPGAAFYPPDLTKEELDNFIALNPGKENQLRSPYTIIRREQGALVAVPFHVAYESWLVPAADMLKKVSTLAENESLARYLTLRAEALLTGEYQQSHIAWIDLVDSDVDLLLAPDEVYDDALFGLKASFEVSVMIRDAAETAKLRAFADHINDMEQNLPVDPAYKRRNAGLASPLVVVRDIFRGGDLATGYQAVAATLPNDPAVQAIKGTKKIFWKNIMDARVEHIILPIAREVFASDQIPFITPDGVFNDVLMHELSHAVGPMFVYHASDSIPVNHALLEQYTAIEEAKADVVGLYSVPLFVSKGLLSEGSQRELYASAAASLFRSIRFGTEEAHGKASLAVLNYLRENGAIRLDPVTGKWSVQFAQFEPAIASLAKELLLIEATGDYEGAVRFFEQWGRLTRDVDETMGRLEHIPVDVDPVYIVRW